MYLLDSDYLINFLNGDRRAVATISKIHRNGLSTSIICIAEVLEGLYLLSHKKKAEQFEEFISAITVFLVDDKVTSEFARMRSNLRKRGQLIDNFDLLIGATCIVYDLTLVTGNVSHFKRIAGLKIY